MWMTGKGVPEEGAPEERQARVPPQREAKGLRAGSSRAPLWPESQGQHLHVWPSPWPGTGQGRSVPFLSDGCHRSQHPLGCPAPSCPSLPTTSMAFLEGTERRPSRHRRPMTGLRLASSQLRGPWAQLGTAAGLTMPRRSPEVGIVRVEGHTEMCA